MLIFKRPRMFLLPPVASPPPLVAVTYGLPGSRAGVNVLGFFSPRTGNQHIGKRTKGDSVYISGGVLALIVVIVLLVWIF